MFTRTVRLAAVLTLLACSGLLAADTAGGQSLSLKTVAIPEPSNLSDFVKDRAAAIALGKALFWDAALGSDGQACASCHFSSGGADSRTRNQLNPGLRAVPPDPLFAGAPFNFGPNRELRVTDFPFFRGPAVFSNDITSSQGVFNARFVDIVPGRSRDLCVVVSDPIFDAHGRARRVEPRNAPTIINAVFNYRNFWDGRARNEFNGVNPIGDLDPFARVVLAPTPNSLLKVKVRIENASLASQAVGPPLSEFEMSCDGRTFPKLGKKMLSLERALDDQLVAPDDSVFDASGRFASRSPKPGIGLNYASLIQMAFQPQWWRADRMITIEGTAPDGTAGLKFGPPPNRRLATNEYTQMEYNFSLFFGIAVQMYEATLVSDDSPFDRYYDGDSTALSEQQKAGLGIFLGKGRCIRCHGGAELTNASVRNVLNEKLERMLMGNDQTAVYDTGFYNTAVTRCGQGMCDDMGLGAAIGPLNLPLSMSRFFQLVLKNDLNARTVCQNQPQACDIPAVTHIAPTSLDPDERIAAAGAFKTPGLRNVELQAPYFHNGGELTLMDVVNFYDRGGNFRALNSGNLDPDIAPLSLTPDEKAALVALMSAMTDERVRYQRAPFDHPELEIENLGKLAAVGRHGNRSPLRTFLENLEGHPEDSSEDMNPSALKRLLFGSVIGSAAGSFVIVESLDPGGAAGPPLPIEPLHVHRGDDEAFYVLEGALRVQVGKEQVEAGKGSGVFVPRGSPHTYWNPSPAPVRYLHIMSSKIFQLLQEIRAIEERTPSALQAVYKKYDSEVLQ